MNLPKKVLSLFRGCEESPSVQKLFYLSLVDIFQDLQPEEMKEIERATSMMTCPTGKIFYMPNDTGEVMFILKKGRVQLYRMSSEGRKLMIATLGAGTVFGEMALTGQGMYDTFAEAAEDSLICIMKRRDVEKLLLSKPKVAIRLLGLISQRLRQAEEKLEETLFRDVPRRLAALLLRLRTEQGSDIIGVTHEDLAEQLGVYRETVTTALSTLQREDLISLGRKKIELKDLSRLQRKAST